MCVCVRRENESREGVMVMKSEKVYSIKGGIVKSLTAPSSYKEMDMNVV